jgi:hypothetical protein
MAAETLTSNQAASAVQPRKHSLSGVLHTEFGYYPVAANVEDGDIFEMCKIPPGALVVGGQFWCSDMDTGTEALDMDCGWADNGGASATITVADGTTYTNMSAGAADPDGFVNAGVLTGDAITDLLASGNLRPFNMAAGPVYFSEETTIQVEANVAAATFAAGTMFVRVDYLVIG